MVSPIHDAVAILNAIEATVRQPRRPTPYRIDFYCDLGHKSKTAHARAWIDDQGKVGIVCFNDASHNKPLWEMLVKEHERPPAYGTPEYDALAEERERRRELRRQRCAEWDRFVAAVAADAGRPPPFPTEPPPENPFEALRMMGDGPFTPPMRTDFLPDWARRALAAAQKETP